MNRRPWICGACGGDYAAASSAAECCGTVPHRRRVFSLSLGDWLDPEVPIGWLAGMLDAVRQCDQVTWILCTKRPELFARRLSQVSNATAGGRESEFFGFGQDPALAAWIGKWKTGTAPRNVWVLASVEDQAALEIRAPQLAAIPAVVHGLSCEPLLGPVDFGNAFDEPTDLSPRAKIDWIVAGGESVGGRPCDVAWIRSVISQCRGAGVPCFVKQLGSNPVAEPGPLSMCCEDPKGADPSEWPPDMRVRNFPGDGLCANTPRRDTPKIGLTAAGPSVCEKENQKADR